MRCSAALIVVAITGLGLASCDSRPASGGGGGIEPVSGAHTAHLHPGLTEPMSCGQCHDAQFQVTLQGPLATANGAQPAFDGAAMTCSNVYCHGGGPGLPLGGGTVPVPVWNPPSAVACGGCHAIPGGSIDTSAWHPAVAAGVQCGICHPGYTSSTVDRSVHVNGVVNLTVPDLGTNCAACHGDGARVLPVGMPDVVKAAPPVDRSGRSDTQLPSVGAHQSHLLPGTGGIASPVACGECHVVPADLSHVGPEPSSPARLAWGPVASAASAAPAYDRTTATCTNYCHGQTLGAGGSNVAPVWTQVDGTQAACGTCHASPPPDLPHVVHVSGVDPNFPCSTCHPDGYSRYAVGDAAIPFHVNGLRDVNASTLPDWNPDAVGPNGWHGTSTGCHGGTRYWSPGVPSLGCY